MPQSTYQIAGFLFSGLLWIASGVSILWWCKRIETQATLRLLAPVLWALATISAFTGYLYAVEMFEEPSAMHFRMNSPYVWVYWLLLFFQLLPISFVLPWVRRSMISISVINIWSFAVCLFPHLNKI